MRKKRKKRKRTVRERSMALIKRREKRRLGRKRKQKGQNWLTSLMVYAPNIEARFRKSRKKAEKPKKVKKPRRGLFRRGGKHE